MSLAVPTWLRLPVACSGDMYDGVPMTAPLCVNVKLEEAACLANPKSAT